MTDIKIINDFVSKSDSDKIIEIIDDLMKSVVREDTGRKDDARFVFFTPNDEYSIKFIKKYAEKVIVESGRNDIYLHDVIYAKSEQGAEVDVHMDFDGSAECQHCPIASVLYLNKDYSGGEIYFPKLEKKYSPEARSVAIFRQDSRDYIHGVSEVTSGNRYIVNICYTTMKNKQLDVYK